MMLWKTCAALKEEGQVMVVGDLNARVGSMQFQPMMQDELDKGETIELDPLWQRYVVDDTVNQHGKALRQHDRCYAHAKLEWNVSLSQHTRHNLLFCKW